MQRKIYSQFPALKGRTYFRGWCLRMHTVCIHGASLCSNQICCLCGLCTLTAFSEPQFFPPPVLLFFFQLWREEALPLSSCRPAPHPFFFFFFVQLICVLMMWDVNKDDLKDIGNIMETRAPHFTVTKPNLTTEYLSLFTDAVSWLIDATVNRQPVWISAQCIIWEVPFPFVRAGHKRLRPIVYHYSTDYPRVITFASLEWAFIST